MELAHESPSGDFVWAIMAVSRTHRLSKRNVWREGCRFAVTAATWPEICGSSEKQARALTAAGEAVANAEPLQLDGKASPKDQNGDGRSGYRVLSKNSQTCLRTNNLWSG